MPGHADSAPEAGGVDDLAQFLADNPGSDDDEGPTADESTLDEDKDEDANAQPEESDEEGDEPDEPEEEPEETPKPERKIPVTIKGEDGSDQTIEVAEEELIKGYTRQADYTRKTQELADRENKAFQFITSKHEEIRNTYLMQAEAARAAVVQVAGIKSAQEMAQLAHSDLAAWVQENQRIQQVSGIVSQLDQQIAAERERSQKEAAENRQKSMKAMYDRAWSELSKDKIDKDALKKIYDGVSESYGFKQEELAEVYDPRLVRVFRDAAELKAIKARAAQATKKATDAPRLPQKQATPRQERQTKQLNERFRSGRAKLTDLAAYLS